MDIYASVELIIEIKGRINMEKYQKNIQFAAEH